MALIPYAVKTVVISSGERPPVLVASATGARLFEPPFTCSARSGLPYSHARDKNIPPCI